MYPLTFFHSMVHGCIEKKWCVYISGGGRRGVCVCNGIQENVVWSVH